MKYELKLFGFKVFSYAKTQVISDEKPCLVDDFAINKLADKSNLFKDKTAEFLSRAYALIKPAATAAKGEFVPRLEKLLIEITYYDLFHNMDRTMDCGTDEEKRACREKNEWLVRKLRENDVRITFWGKTGADQQKNLDPTVPPSKWDYSW